MSGRTQFTKVTVNRESTKIFEAELRDIQFLEKVEASTFADP